jgi:hypothetical protein
VNQFRKKEVKLSGFYPVSRKKIRQASVIFLVVLHSEDEYVTIFSTVAYVNSLKR